MVGSEDSFKRHLLEASTVKSILENEFKNSQRIVIISAYVTHSAIEWLIGNISSTADVRLLARLSPVDFLSNSSDIKALNTFLDHGFKLGMLENLHAKLYMLDNRRILVGSANFTTNGLNLYGEGNLEV